MNSIQALLRRANLNKRAIAMVITFSTPVLPTLQDVSDAKEIHSLSAQVTKVIYRRKTQAREKTL